MVSVRQATTPTDFEQGTELLREYASWILDASGINPYEVLSGLASEVDSLGDHYRGPGGALFLASAKHAAVGILAVRIHEDGSGELKRMYVRPDTRGGGAADQLIIAATDHAHARGCTRVWLESKRGLMDRAIAVYRRNGFRELPENGRTMQFDGVVVMEQTLERKRSAA